MSPRKKRAGKRRKRSKRRQGRLRRALGILVAVAVVAAVGFVWLWVGVGRRFEGRLWLLPSHVYSDTWTLRSGMQLSPLAVTERLQRSGYARTSSLPGRPGQYRNAGNRIELNLREFSDGTRQFPETRLTLRFATGRLVEIAEHGGAGATTAVLEPELLATLYGPRQEDREPLPLDSIPETLLRSVLAAEDSRYLKHGGFDTLGILRAGWANLTHGRIVQGGSTITQQTVKNLYLDPRRTWWRKAREVVIAVMLDARYPKERILEVYLNEVYLGQRGSVAICGVQAASRFYFGRDVEDLGLAEAALLAGLIRSPGTYNPFRDPERAIARRAQVLDALGRLGWAEEAEIEAARAAPLQLASGQGGFERAPYAVDFVVAQLLELYPDMVLESEGLRIYTTLDTHLQALAEQSLERGLERLETRREAGETERRLQGAVVVTDPTASEVRALVGGRDYAASQFNRATQARRQPGSCFKPFVYAAGFELMQERDEDGLTPSTILDDSPLELAASDGVWRPANYDHQHRGDVTVRQALEESLNVPTVRAAQQIGIPRIIAVARRCGIRSPMPELPSLALGTAEVTPLELAEAYGTLANRGERVPLGIVRAVVDAEGEIIELRQPVRMTAISSQTAYLVDDVMRGVFTRGTARSAAGLGFESPAAGKTGTTDGTRDAWFVGYTAELLTLVWVGYDDNAMTGLTGATGALPIWADLMRRTEVDRSSESEPLPEGLVLVEVCQETGQVAVRKCPVIVESTFVAGTEPTTHCVEHQGKLKRWWRKLLGKN